MSAFDEDSVITNGIATLSPRWNNPAGSANGGYLASLCTKALAEVLPQPDPLVVSAFFLRRSAAGAASLTTEVVRTGRRVSTGEARLAQTAGEILRVVASFGDLARATGRSLVLNEPPRLPPPEDCRDLYDEQTVSEVPVARMMHYRFRERPGWRVGRPSGHPHAELWMRFADGRDADVSTLPLFVDAAAPAVFEIGARSSTTLELTVHVRARPARGWIACRISTRHVIGGYHEEDVELWDASGSLVAQSRQLAILEEPESAAGTVVDPSR